MIERDASGHPARLFLPVPPAPDLRLGRWQDVLADVECDAVICDPPYSDRTHAGVRSGVSASKRWHRSGQAPDSASDRRAIPYAHWTQDDMREFCAHWSDRCRGWIVLIIDHIEARWAEEELEACGRYVFAPLPFVETGRTVRLTGDGPSSWTSWVVVARPKSDSFRRWGTLPGAYIGRGGPRADRYIGGKPPDLMRALVSDYSRPGDLVCDPCLGWGTTAAAAIGKGRRFVGAEVDAEAFREAQRRLSGVGRQGDLLGVG